MANNAGHENDIAKRIAERNPLTYAGQEDPRILEDWIRAFDKLLGTEKCPEEEMVEVSTFYLQQEADLWWVTNGPVLREQPNFGWTIFKEAMRDRFYSHAVKMEKYTSFSI